MTDLPVGHGYTLNNLDHMARIVTLRTDHLGMHPNDRYDLAHQAMAETLCSATTVPTARELMLAAQLACQRDRRTHLAERGKYIHSADATGSQFHRYWSGRLESPWEDSVIDRIALIQIWPHLADVYRQTLTTLALHGHYDAAAEHLGISYAAFGNRLKRARSAFKELWHEGEVPSRQWGRDERKRRGDSSAMQSRYTRPSRGGRRGFHTVEDGGR